jgi:hypothetical protein
MTKRSPQSAGHPEYCDFSCPHAAFSDPAASGACRREIAVWCTALRAYNDKHARCLFADEGKPLTRIKPMRKKA